MTPDQRTHALALAIRGVGRLDVARCLQMEPNNFDSAIRGDREIIAAFGLAKASPYDGLAKKRTVRNLQKDLERDGAQFDASDFSLRITCKCASVLAVLRHGGHDISHVECERIRAKITSCRCMRKQHKNRRSRNA